MCARRPGPAHIYYGSSQTFVTPVLLDSWIRSEILNDYIHPNEDMRFTIILACSLVDPALAFGAVPACTDMDSPSFSALTNELAAEVGLFSPGEW